MNNGLLSIEMFKRLKMYEEGRLLGPEHLHLYTNINCSAKCKFCGHRWISGLLKSEEKKNKSLLEFIAAVILDLEKNISQEVLALIDKRKDTENIDEELELLKEKVDNILENIKNTG